MSRGLRAATRRDRAATILDVAGALLRDELLELHWLAFDLLDRTIAAEPERTWQLVRAEAVQAADWITVDSLAHVAGRGILAEPYRWAELEQLVYSPSRWERRLVGLDDRHHPARRPRRRPAAGDRPPGPRDPRPTSSATPSPTSRRPCRGPCARSRRSTPRRRPRSCAARRRRPARPTTATAPGSSATPSRSSPPTRPTSCGPPSTASASAPAPPRPPAPPEPPPPSPASASRCRPPSARS